MPDFQVVPPKPQVSDDMLVAVVLDQSGSMSSCRDQTISGFNEYVQTLRNMEKKGEITLTLVKFPKPGAWTGMLTKSVMRSFNPTMTAFKESSEKDETVDVVYTGKPLMEVADLNTETYTPTGGTPLLDAVGKTVTAIDAHLKSQPQPWPRVVVVIITDGGENQSREYRGDAIKKLIEQHEAEAGWNFVFIGANQDAWDVGGSLGIKMSKISNYGVGETKAMFARTAAATERLYASGAAATMDSYEFFTKEEQAEGDKDAGRS